MNTVENISLFGKKALIRVDFNVPLNEKFEITDDTRINAAIPTIKKILSQGGSVILMSHLGRPKDGPEDKFSLRHLIKPLSEKLDIDVMFANDCIGEEAIEKASKLMPCEVLLLENLRFYKEETKGDREFARKLADLGDVYVNDAFGTAHRAHASTAIIADFFDKDSKAFGLLMAKEVESINKVMNEGKKPFTAILGGAKVSGKIEIINHLMEKVDNMIIGGGMIFTFAKAMGGNVGSSLLEEDLLDTARQALEKAKKLGVNIYLPTDVVVADAFDNNANTKVCPIGDIPDNWMGLDIGSESIAKFEEVIANSSTILWNGPMGVFEMSSFEAGTKSVAYAVAKAVSKGAFSVIGGGDSVAAVNKYDLKDKVGYVSTGGGAMLEFIEGKKLPGVEALSEK
ncbi:MAG: phosphoglycerate kinase [Hyphomicrobiales bacterium]